MHPKTANSLRLRVAATVAGGLLAALPATASAGLAERLGEGVEVSRHAETATVGFIGTEPGTSLASGAPASASAVEGARSFITGHARSFGLAADGAGLRTVEAHRTAGGGSAVRLQQTHRGMPVLGGLLVVNLDAAGDVLSVLGETSPSPKSAPVAGIGREQASAAAIGTVARSEDVGADTLEAKSAKLQVYDPRLLGAPGPLQRARTSWVVEVSADDRGVPIDELVVVDAETGAVALNFSQIDEALERRICDADNLRPRSPARRRSRFVTRVTPRRRQRRRRQQGLRLRRRHLRLLLRPLRPRQPRRRGPAHAVDRRLLRPVPAVPVRQRVLERPADGLRRRLRRGRRRRRPRAHPRGHRVQPRASSTTTSRVRSTSRCPTSSASSIDLTNTAAATTPPAMRWLIGEDIRSARSATWQNPPPSTTRTG